MITLSEADKDHFKRFGWVSVSMGLNTLEIDYYFNLVKKIKENAILKKYKYGRIYYDYLTTYNLAAVELPFNEEVFPHELKALFEKIELGRAILSLMSWDETYCSLARLFCMSHFNYRGKWHRDFELRSNSIHCADRVQVGIYLTRQYGFRLLKKEYDVGGESSLFEGSNDSSAIENSCKIYQPPKDAYFTVGGEPGTILFFNPLMLHQGSSSVCRYDFHMRFDRLLDTQEGRLGINNFQDFKIIRNLLNKPILENSDIDFLPIIKRKTVLVRALNQINYYFPFENLKRGLIKNPLCTNSDFKYDLLANTVYQNNI